ncbi:uncharacterized mitochondrial protein AtMg00810-like [Prosopis cineraria]|uniref:uncharacterized mitochondrial protein AtMg00810-like n=1 Tax=Prosopis cineraria TaxID=364024 RepID=UPI00241089F5|nr:uncharacterized mitochondrial protein AtMg00810-like [Prosopis cineraria]
MEVARSQKGIYVSQRKYILNLLNEIGMLGCKLTETPIVVKRKGKKLKKDMKNEEDEVEFEEDDCEEEEEKNESVKKKRYQKLVGKLIYLSHARLDIAFAVSVTSQYMCDPRESHMEAVYKILRYLKVTPGKRLLFKKQNLQSIEIYTDANWGGAYKDKRSTSSYCSFVWGNLVS